MIQSLNFVNATDVFQNLDIDDLLGWLSEVFDEFNWGNNDYTLISKENALLFVNPNSKAGKMIANLPDDTFINLEA